MGGTDRAGRGIALALLLWATTADAGPLRVVELFQSQGCSSCPPANANLNAIADRADVIALSYAVTYWDHLGWKDRFARPEFTARQRAYQQGLGNSNIYTPQMVVNGRRDLVGARAADVAAALQAAPALDGQRIIVHNATVRAQISGRADVWLVAYDPGSRRVAVGAGENSGRTLPHRNIVLRLTRLGAADGLAHALPAPRSGEARVLLLQRPGGAILDARRI